MILEHPIYKALTETLFHWQRALQRVNQVPSTLAVIEVPRRRMARTTFAVLGLRILSAFILSTPLACSLQSKRNVEAEKSEYKVGNIFIYW